MAKTKNRKKQKKSPLSFRVSATLVVLIAVGAGIFAGGLLKRYGVNAANCTISDKLVNSCRPWLSAATGGYPQASGNDQFAYFNKRLNNPGVLTNPAAATTITYKMDVPHVYHTPGQTLFNSTAQRVLNDSSLYNPGNPVLVNWKPGDRWGDTANGAADSAIIASAQAVKSLGARKIFLTLWHEPENDNVNDTGLSITGSCKRPAGTTGSAAEYRAMWRHVRDVFNQQGVTNVVWFWNPMGYVAWDCIVKDLYPGNDLVDWIMWDPYSSEGNFEQSISRFYNFLSNNSTTGHNFTSKPWGLAEHGSNSQPTQAAGYWNQGKSTIGSTWSANKFPNLKLYSVFDTSVNGGVNGGLRVGYDINGGIDVNEQTAFNGFAQNILKFGDQGGTAPPPPPPAGDTIPPTVSITSPADGTEQKGTIVVTGQASDNVRVTAVTLRINDKWLATDGSAPYSFTLNTKDYADGKYALALRAWDPSNNAGQSQSVIISINNTPGTGPGEGDPPPASGGVITPTTPTSPTNPLRARGSVVVSPTTPGNAVQLLLNGKPLPSNVIDTSSLPNGTHVLTILENGQSTTQYIAVNNPLPLAVLNHVRDKAVPYTVGSVTVIALALLWVGRSYITGLTSRKERRLIKKQRSYRG